MQVFKTPSVFIFTESFISARSFELLSSFLSFRVAGLTQYFLQGKEGHKLPGSGLSGDVSTSPTLWRTVLLDTGFLVGSHFFLALWINQPSLWPPKFLKEICPWSWGSFLTNVLFYQVLSTLCPFPRILYLKYSLIKCTISVWEPGLQLTSW